MTIASDLNKHIYHGNGVTTQWPYTFALLDINDMKVYLTNPETGEDILITQDYIVDTINLEVVYPGYEPGTEPPPELQPPTLPDDWKITLLRQVPITQESSYPNNSTLYPRVIETTFDRATMQIQQLKEKVDRAFVAGVSAEYELTLPEPVANAVLKWKDDLSGLENGTTTDSVISVMDLLAIITDHIEAILNAHPASAIFYTPSTGGCSSTVQIALDFIYTYYNPDLVRIALATFNSISNFKAQVTSNTIISITANNNPFADTGSVSLSLRTNVSGANGLDTGSVANSTWYYMYLIYGDSGTASLLSTSSTFPNLPSGYIYFVRVGTVRTNSSGYLIRTIQYGKRTQYINDGTILTSLPTIVSSTHGSVTTPTYVSTSITTIVPPTAKIINLNIAGNGATTIVAPNSHYGAYNNSTNPPFAAAMGGSGPMSYKISMILESNYIYSASNDTNGIIKCAGWEDNL